MNEEYCKDCKFYHQGTGSITRCRRFPPASTGYFPPVSPDSLCGEYKPKYLKEILTE